MDLSPTLYTCDLKPSPLHPLFPVWTVSNLSQTFPSITFPTKILHHRLPFSAATMTSSSNPLDLEITIVSAKQLKNVNWRNGHLVPYVTVYIDPTHRLSTLPDHSGSTRPVWKEQLTLPITGPIHDSVLTLEIFHFNSAETPKPLVGTLRFQLTQVVESGDSTQSIYSLELKRPSGRPQGKVRVKLAVGERNFQSYSNTPRNENFYGKVLSPSSRDYREFSPSPLSSSDQYSGQYMGYYSPPPPPPSQYQPSFTRVYNYSLTDRPSTPVDFSSSNDLNLSLSPIRASNYGAPRDPSAPVDFSPPLTSNYNAPSGPSAPVDLSSYDHRFQKGTGGVGTIAGALGGLSLGEGVKYEEDKVAEEEHGYGHYRRDY